MRWDVAGAQRAAAGESECGDAYLIRDLGDHVLVAVVDGLGHGASARHAAEAFIQIVEKAPRAPLVRLVAEAGEALSSTRGVVATLVRLLENRVEVVGVGNVRIVARTRGHFHAMPTPGIIGARRPGLRAARTTCAEVTTGDLLAICTDGVGRTSPPQDHVGTPAAELAHALLGAGPSSDDATAVVARALP